MDEETTRGYLVDRALYHAEGLNALIDELEGRGATVSVVAIPDFRRDMGQALDPSRVKLVVTFGETH
jgi:hypothetical protein